MYADTVYIPHDIHDVYRRHRPYCSTRTTLKVAHSRGLRPLPPTPRKSCRRVVSGDASEAVLKSAFRTDGANRTSSKLLGRRQTVALLSNCDIKRFQNCPVRMEGAQRTISEMSGRCKTVAQPFHAIGTEKMHFDLPRPRREGQKPRMRPTEYPGDGPEPRPIEIPTVLIGFRHTRGRPP